MTSKLEDAVTKNMGDSLMDDQDKTTKPKRDFSSFGEMGSGGHYTTTKSSKTARTAAAFKEYEKLRDDRVANEATARSPEPVDYDALEIPDYLKQTSPEAAAADHEGMPVPHKVDEGLVKIAMADAEVMADIMGRYLGEYMEMHDIIWTEKGAEAFRFACMKGLALCKMRYPGKHGSEPYYRDIAITTNNAVGDA